jgi:NADH-quinone oxidoreductase subunit A
MGSASLIILLIIAIAFAIVAVYIGRIFGTSSTNPVKGEPYECGIETKGETWIQFHIGYYLFALLFLVFDVEIVFLFPWATVIRELGIVALIEIFFFTLFLFLGLLYAYKKKALSWM